MKRSAYLAGPMRGVPEFNFPLFMRVETWLEGRGFHVFNPARHDLDTGAVAITDPGYALGDIDGLPRFDLAEAFEWDNAAIRVSDGIVMLPGWHESKGAQEEYALAHRLEKDVYLLESGWGGTDEFSMVAEPKPCWCGVDEEWDDPEEAIDPEVQARATRFPIEGYQDIGAVYEHEHLDYSPPPTFSEMVDTWLDEQERKVFGDVGAAALDALVAPEQERIAPRWLQGLVGGIEENLNRSVYTLPTTKEQWLRGEHMVVDPVTGGAKGSKLARFDLLPYDALTLVAEHFGKGASKYADRNWERGYDWGLSMAALQRHLAAFWSGEDVDEETDSLHLQAVVFHALALLTFQIRDIGTDSRGTVA